MSVPHAPVQRADFDQLMVPVFAPAAFASSAELEGNWDNERPSAGGLAELDLAFDGAEKLESIEAVFATQFGGAA